MNSDAHPDVHAHFTRELIASTEALSKKEDTTVTKPILRAKFQVRYIVRRDANWAIVPKDVPAKSEIVYLSPVYGNGEANKEWSEATPAGNLEMTINNPGAHGKLVEGKEYFIDFTPVE